MDRRGRCVSCVAAMLLAGCISGEKGPIVLDSCSPETVSLDAAVDLDAAVEEAVASYRGLAGAWSVDATSCAGSKGPWTLDLQIAPDAEVRVVDGGFKSAEECEIGHAPLAVTVTTVPSDLELAGSYELTATFTTGLYEVTADGASDSGEMLAIFVSGSDRRGEIGTSVKSEKGASDESCPLTDWQAE